MAFAAAAVVTPVPRILSTGAAAAIDYAGSFCISVPAPAPSYFRLSSIRPSSSQLALTHSLVPLSRSFPRSWLLRSALQEANSVLGGVADVEPSEEQVLAASGGKTRTRTLYVENLPWDFLAAEIENLFAQGGTVERVDIMKQKNGKSRGFAFVTMGSEEEAKAAIEKLDSYELGERIIRVEYAKSTKKPPSTPPAPVNIEQTKHSEEPSPAAPVKAKETRHVIYVSNIAWEVRSNNLREFFSASFKPVGARVIFNSLTKKPAGFGFVSFKTAEEMKAAISELNGKELMGRPVRLKIREKKSESRDKEETSDADGNKEEEASESGGLAEV